MQYLWSFTIDQYLEIAELAKSAGIKPGESMEPVLLAYAEAKGIKPCGATELNKEELINEYVSHGKKILDIETKEDGQQIIRSIKPKEEE